MTTNENGERHFAYYGKTNNLLCFEDIDCSLLKRGSIIHVGSAMALGGLDGDGLMRLMCAARERGCMTSLDVTWDQEGKWLPKIERALPYVDIFAPSLYEATKIVGETDPGKIAAAFKRYGVQTVLVKLGEQGCFVSDGREELLLPSLYQGVPADTTGAGDAFVSGYLFGVSRCLPARQCATIGSRLAKTCLGAYGSTQGIEKQYATAESIAELLQL